MGINTAGFGDGFGLCGARARGKRKTCDPMHASHGVPPLVSTAGESGLNAGDGFSGRLCTEDLSALDPGLH